MIGKSAVVIALLASSAAAFNGQPTNSFALRQSTETALKMSGGNAAPALKVSVWLSM